MGRRNELRFNYLSLLLTDGRELSPDHRMLFSAAEQRLWLTLLAKTTFDLTRGAKLQDR